MKILVLFGLGNHGAKFENTRHNLGIMVLRAWLDTKKNEGFEVSPWKTDSDCQAEIAIIRMNDIVVYAVFPLTFMNDSGIAVSHVLKKKQISISDIIVLHDEIDEELGDMQYRASGSARGHNGMRSIIDSLGTDEIKRIGFGVGRPKDDMPVKAYVLQRFSPKELEVIQQQMPHYLVAVNNALLAGSG